MVKSYDGTDDRRKCDVENVNSESTDKFLNCTTDLILCLLGNPSLYCSCGWFGIAFTRVSSYTEKGVTECFVWIWQCKDTLGGHCESDAMGLGHSWKCEKRGGPSYWHGSDVRVGVLYSSTPPDLIDVASPNERTSPHTILEKSCQPSHEP